MTPPPTPLPPALSADEREVAARLAKLDAAAGPSAALDARILGAARVAATASRPARRWPGALGAAAVLVAAVGLAWQLRPMFELPPPAVHDESVGDAGTSGAERETVVQIESIRRAPPPVAPAGDVAASTARPAAARHAPPVAGGTAPTPARVVHRPTARSRSPEFVDEAVPATDAATAPPAAPAPPLPREAPRVAASVARSAAADLGGIAADSRLAAPEWLVRIRERRDAGDVEGARRSLQRFIAAHPRVLVPSDLRPLLRDDEPARP